MRCSENIQRVLAGLNGADATTLRAASERLVATEPSAVALAERLGERDLERAASWMLKHWIDSRRVAITKALAVRITERAVLCGDWEARLHVLQMAGHIDFSAVAVEGFARFLNECVADERRITRAWAYDACDHLAHQVPAYRPHVLGVLERAEQTETAGSIRARLRRIRARRSPTET